MTVPDGLHFTPTSLIISNSFNSLWFLGLVLGLPLCAFATRSSLRGRYRIVLGLSGLMFSLLPLVIWLQFRALSVVFHLSGVVELRGESPSNLRLTGFDMLEIQRASRVDDGEEHVTYQLAVQEAGGLEVSLVHLSPSELPVVMGELMRRLATVPHSSLRRIVGGVYVENAAVRKQVAAFNRSHSPPVPTFASTDEWILPPPLSAEQHSLLRPESNFLKERKGDMESFSWATRASLPGLLLGLCLAAIFVVLGVTQRNESRVVRYFVLPFSVILTAALLSALPAAIVGRTFVVIESGRVRTWQAVGPWIFNEQSAARGEVHWVYLNLLDRQESPAVILFGPQHLRTLSGRGVLFVAPGHRLPGRPTETPEEPSSVRFNLLQIELGDLARWATTDRPFSVPVAALSPDEQLLLYAQLRRWQTHPKVRVAY